MGARSLAMTARPVPRRHWRSYGSGICFPSVKDDKIIKVLMINAGIMEAP